MVGKVTTGASFTGLARYLAGDPERVEWTEPRWMIGTDPEEVAREMEAAAGMSSRVEKPVYHISIAFRDTDRPTREQMRQAADHVLKELGLEEHQAFLVAHGDKEHPHLHVMVNRVHPQTGLATQVSFDYRQIERTLRDLESRWGMARVPGHHARSPQDLAPDRSRSRTTGEIRHARRAGEPAFPDEVRAKVGTAFRESTSWSELSDRLALHGYRVEPTERGMVITDGVRRASASRVDPEAGRFQLEKQFGQELVDYLRKEREGQDLATARLYRELFSMPALKTPREERDKQLSSTEAQRDAAAPKDSGIYREFFSQPALAPATPETERVSRSDRKSDEQHTGPGNTSPVERPAQVEHTGSQAFRGNAAPAADRAQTKGTGPGENASKNTRAGGAAGVLQAAARPISSEDGEKDIPLRGLEVAIRGGAMFTGSTPGRGTGDEAPAKSHSAEVDLDKLIQDVNLYEKLIEKERALHGTATSYAGLESKLQHAADTRSRVEAYEQAFTRHLARTYVDPAAARTAFVERAEKEGTAAAAQAMRVSPEQFGNVLETRSRKWLGLATEIDKTDAFGAARSAADYGEQYLRSQASKPGAAQMSKWKQSLETTSHRMSMLKQELGSTDTGRLLRSIHRRASTLTPGQMSSLRRALSSSSFSLVRQSASYLTKPLRDRAR